MSAERAANEKRMAAVAAMDEVDSGMLVGLGTGSTIRYFLDALGEALAAGRLKDVRGVPTSIDTERRCRELAIPTTDLPAEVPLDLAVDGADEVSPDLNLVKGLGGALLREKIVAQAARRFIVVVDSSKQVAALGERAPIPVEVVPFGWRAHLAFFRTLGADPVPRRSADGNLIVTDNGNHVVDLTFSPAVADPPGLEQTLQRRAGVIETGLFLGFAHRVVVGRPEGVVSLERSGP